MPYEPLKISGFETGLVQEREDYIIPDDAFPVLFNAYVWRERILRKRGSSSLGRLRRTLTSQAIPGGAAASPWSFNLFTILMLAGSSARELESGSVSFDINAGAIILTDQGDGTLLQTGGGGVGSGTINYATGAITITHNQPVASATTVTLSYFPSLPVMGIKLREKGELNNEQYIAFDTKFAYTLTGTTWDELIAGTVWDGSDSDFFWTTNFWVNASNQKLFWATNFVNSASNPIRYYDGSGWTDFSPNITDPAGSNIKLLTSRILLPFRGRMVALNTIEGTAFGTGVQYPQRIRWAAIGSPIEAEAWREDIRGKGAYLDIPTSQNIVSAGFVRDNLVVYCERSTWQLRYTGNVIQPFQIERVNTELGVESTFSGVQFDTSLVGIGDKGIVECDSFKSTRLDQKIPDLVYSINNEDEGVKRVNGYRDFRNRLAFWSYPDGFTLENGQKFPNRRLIFNYENGSWGIFRDSITAMGVAQVTTDKTWQEDVQWQDADFPWYEAIPLQPEVVGGNQQGFIFSLDQKQVNDPSLTITDIAGNVTAATTVTSYDHSLENGEIIEITGIVGDFSGLNGKRYAVSYVDKDTFNLLEYSDESRDFTSPSLHAVGNYTGNGRISVIDNFHISTKKFNFIDSGKRIMIGFVDLLMATTDEGAITIQVNEDYNPITINQQTGDLFFNTTIPTSPQDPADGSTKTMQRIFCRTRGSFLTINLLLSREQMNGDAAKSDVQIDGLIVWRRPAEKQLYTGEIR